MKFLPVFERTLAICWVLFFAWWVADGLRQLISDAEYLSVFATTAALLSVVVLCSVLLWRQSKWRYASLVPVALATLVGFAIFLSNAQGFPFIDLAFGWFALALAVSSLCIAVFGLLRPKPGRLG
jgi:xanthine/uracil permease